VSVSLVQYESQVAVWVSIRLSQLKTLEAFFLFFPFFPEASTSSTRRHQPLLFFNSATDMRPWTSMSPVAACPFELFSAFRVSISIFAFSAILS